MNAYLFIFFTVVVNAVLGVFSPVFNLSLVESYQYEEQYTSHWEQVIEIVEYGVEGEDYEQFFNWSWSNPRNFGQCYRMTINGEEYIISVMDYNDIKDNEAYYVNPDRSLTWNSLISEIIPEGLNANEFTSRFKGLFYFYTFNIPGMPVFIPAIMHCFNLMCVFVVVRMVRGVD
jgi:hypothetical protein